MKKELGNQPDSLGFLVGTIGLEPATPDIDHNYVDNALFLLAVTVPLFGHFTLFWIVMTPQATKKSS